jgi:hypothetical protein
MSDLARQYLVCCCVRCNGRTVHRTTFWRHNNLDLVDNSGQPAEGNNYDQDELHTDHYSDQQKEEKTVVTISFGEDDDKEDEQLTNESESDSEPDLDDVDFHMFDDNEEEMVNEEIITEEKLDFIVLKLTLQLLNSQTIHNTSQAQITSFLEIIKDTLGPFLPQPLYDKLPCSYRQAIKSISFFDNNHETFDVCIRECKVYKHDDNSSTCCFCGEQRFHSDGHTARLTVQFCSLGNFLKNIYSNKVFCLVSAGC